MYKKGFTLIEILVIFGLTAIILPALFVGFMSGRSGKGQQEQRILALGLLQEASEAVRSYRENDWTQFAVNGTYHPVLSNNAWTLVSGSEVINGFTRQIVVSDVQRHNGAIVQSGGTVDPSTKQVVISVSWNSPSPGSTDSTLYLTRYLDNISRTETTQTDFNNTNAVKAGVTVRSTTGSSVPDDGEIILSAGGNGDWCTPSLLVNGLDLAGNGEATDLTAVEGRAFVGTGQNASGMDFINVIISNPESPAQPSASMNGTYDDNAKTNGVFGETVGSASYAYIATDKDGIVILNANNNPPNRLAIVKPSGSAQAVTVANNILYFTSGSTLYTYNIANRSAPVQLDSIAIPSTAKKIVVSSNHIFIALLSTSVQLKIIDATNPADLISRGQLTLNSSTGQDLDVNDSGTKVYMVTSASTGKEFFIINTSNKSSPAPLSNTSNFETGSMSPRGVSVVPGNRAIIVGSGGTQYQVLSIDNENAPVACGPGLSTNDIYSISSVREEDGDVYSYIVTTNSTKEFQIIAGGYGGSYSDTGIFESAPFDPGYQTANNRFSATYSQPAETTINFQVTMATLVTTGCPVGQTSCCPANGAYTFVGPGGTDDPNDVFTQASGTSVSFPAINYKTYANPGQCMRYKVYFSSTNGNSTSVLNDLTINYSP